MKIKITKIFGYNLTTPRKVPSLLQKNFFIIRGKKVVFTFLLIPLLYQQLNRTNNDVMQAELYFAKRQKF